MQSITQFVRKIHKTITLLSAQKKLALGFLIYIIAGVLFLSLPISQKVTVPFIDNLFTSASAVSTTGLISLQLDTSYTFFGQLVILLLIQVGGIGYLTFSSFLLLSAKNKLSSDRQDVLNAEFAVPKDIDKKVFLKSVIFFTFFVEGAGALALLSAFTYNDTPFFFALWSAIFHSVSAFCTAGFSLYGNSLEGFTSVPFISGIIAMISIFGAFGFIPVTDIVKNIAGEQTRISYTTRVIFFSFFALVGFSSIVILLTEKSMGDLPLMTKASAAFFQSVNAATTAGFNNISTANLGQPSLLVLILLMFVGAAPSGTGGGIRNTSFVAVMAMIWSRIRGRTMVTLGNKVFPFRRVYAAVVTTTFYTAILFFITLLLTFTEAAPLKDILFEVSSALGTVGLSTGLTANLTDIGKAIIVFAMFVGRIGVLTFGLALFASGSKDDAEEHLRHIDIAV